MHRRMREVQAAVIMVVTVILLAVLPGLVSSSRIPAIMNREEINSSESDQDLAAYGSASYCLSWRMGVETGNIRGWRTVPTQCFHHIAAYMMGAQYERDLSLIMEHIITHVDSVSALLQNDGFDAWILDVDDTCLSNLFYYRSKHFGCEPYDPDGFRTWASRGGSSAIPAVLTLFNTLVDAGFKVFLITGRDKDTLEQPTVFNLQTQGFIGYERLILRTSAYRGQSAVDYKREMRRQLVVDGGYRIWGNVGDQWSDLLGDYAGNRTFKLPNPMYFVP